jgi:hypothetical protein
MAVIFERSHRCSPAASMNLNAMIRCAGNQLYDGSSDTFLHGAGVKLCVAAAAKCNTRDVRARYLKAQGKIKPEEKKAGSCNTLQKGSNNQLRISKGCVNGRLKRTNKHNAEVQAARQD